MWEGGTIIIGSLKYWQFSNTLIMDLVNPRQLNGDNAAKAAQELFQIKFLHSENKGLCYNGVAATKNPFVLYEIIDDNGVCYIAKENNNGPIRPSWVWSFEGEEIAPLPEGDGYVVKPTKVLEKEHPLTFVNDMTQFDYKDIQREVRKDIVECCHSINKRFGEIWINQYNPLFTQYKLYQDVLSGKIKPYFSLGRV